jgi:hypothetical protein
MGLSGGRTDSPNAPGCSSPRQTPPTEDTNDTTVIRDAIDTQPEAKAKLRKSNKPMKSGTPPNSSPNRAAMRCRATYTGKVWSYWFFIGLRSKALCSHAEASLSLVGYLLAHPEQRRLHYRRSAASRLFGTRGQKGIRSSLVLYTVAVC